MVCRQGSLVDIVARAYSWPADLKIAKTAMRAMRGKKNRERGCIFILLIIFKTKLIKIHTNYHETDSKN